MWIFVNHISNIFVTIYIFNLDFLFWNELEFHM